MQDEGFQWRERESESENKRRRYWRLLTMINHHLLRDRLEDLEALLEE